MKRLLGLLCALLFSVPAFADQCNMLPSMDTWSNGGTNGWVPTLYATQKTFSFPITLLSGGTDGYNNVPVKLVKVKPNTKYTLYTDVSASSGDKFGWEYAGYKTEADAVNTSATPSSTINSHATFSQGGNNIHKVVTITTTADTEYLVVSPTNWGSGASVTLTAESKIIMVEGDSITNTNIPQCGATTSNSLPSGYQQLEYLQSDGNAYIDTGINTARTQRVEYDVQLNHIVTGGDSTQILGTGGAATDILYSVRFQSDTNIKFYTSGVSVETNNPQDLNRHKITLDVLNHTFSVDNDSYTMEYNLTGTSYKQYLFAYSRIGQADTMYGFKGKMYSAKIWDNNILVRDFIPARRVSDGVLGMYDLADSNTNTAFHTNAGTGTFIAGPTIIPNTFERLRYIESTGTQWIDTGIVGNQDTKVDIDFVVTGDTSTPFWPFGSRAESNQAAFAIWASSGTVGTAFRVGFDGTQGYTGNAVTQNTRYHVISSKEGIYMNGALGYTPTGYSSFTTPSNLMLFAAYNNNREIVQTGTKMQLFSCSLYDNGTLVQDLIPVKRLSDGEVGMFDTVTGAFLTNSGTGDFVAGPSAAIKIATTAYNTAKFSSVVTALSNAVDTIKTVVANTINQATAVANLQSGKQQRPDESCPAGKTCLLVEDENGDPHWYEIVESYTPTLPAGFTELAYLQSDGNQYIDTGYALQTDNFEIHSKYIKISAGPLFGARLQVSPYIGPIESSISNAAIAYWSNNDSWMTSNISLNTLVESVYKSENLNVSVNINGTTKTATAARSFVNGNNIYLFGNNGGNNSVSKGVMKVYSFKIYDDGTLVRDFVPAQHGNDVGMYDLANGQFYTDAAGGNFTAGPVVLPEGFTTLQYIESTGTQYIDTGVTINDQYSYELRYTLNGASQSMGGIAGKVEFRENNSGSLKGFVYGASGAAWSNENYSASDFTTTYKLQENKLYANGTLVNTFTPRTFTSTVNFNLFRRNIEPDSGSAIQYANGKLAYFKMWDNTGTLVRNFVPAKQGNIVGMYDLVSGQFFTNRGSGTFTAGPVVQ